MYQEWYIGDVPRLAFAAKGASEHLGKAAAPKHLGLNDYYFNAFC